MRYGRGVPLSRGALERAVYRGTLAALQAYAAPLQVPARQAPVEAQDEAAEAAQEGLADAVAELVATLEEVQAAPMPAPAPASDHVASVRREVKATRAPKPRGLLRDAVQARRLERGLEWQDVADEMGLPRASLKNWYAGAPSLRVDEKARAWLLALPAAAPVPEAPAPVEPPAPAAEVAPPVSDAKPLPALPPPPIAAQAEPVLAPTAGPDTYLLASVQRTHEARPKMAPAPPAAPAPRLRRDEGETVAATHKQVRDYLVGRLIASGVGKLLAADRVAALTHAEALEQANERRIAAGQLPLRFVGITSNGKAA